MEPLWSPVVATSGNRSQMGHARNCGIKPKTLAGTRRPGLDRTTLTGERLARQAEPGGHSGQGCEGKEVPANLLVWLGATVRVCFGFVACTCLADDAFVT